MIVCVDNCAPISGVGDSLRTVINAIRAKNSAIKILLTGYGMPSAELGGGCTLSAIANIEASVNGKTCRDEARIGILL